MVPSLPVESISTGMPSAPTGALWMLPIKRLLRTTVKSVGFVKYWEVIADRLPDAGWSLGWVSAVDSQGREIWIVDAHGYGKRFIVRAEEILTAFLELERAIRQFAATLVA